MTAFLSDSPEQSPPVQTHTLREFEEHLNDLKKENFSLKLRIYFLEERVQQKYDDSSEDVYRRNIELKVEVESLKRELRDKQQFIDKSWAAGDISSHNDSELRRHYEERQQETEHVQELLENKIQLLQEETKLAKNEAERMAAVAEKEKKSCLELSRKLKEFTADMTEARILQNQYCVTLADKDKMLQQLTQMLDSKDAQIQHLSSDKQNQQDERVTCLEATVQELTAALQQKEQEVKNLIEKKHVGAEQCVLEPKTAELQGGALQDRLHEMEDTNKVLQEKLLQMSSKFTAAHEESQKNNFIIRSLNETLLSKTSEAEDLNMIIEEQNASIIKLQEMLHQIQVHRLQVPGSPPPTQPEVDLLNLQNSLFCTQLEMQKAHRAVRQKERQLTDARRAQQMLEAELRDAQQQKESTWTHNQDLHVTLHQLQTQLQETTQQLQTVEAQKDSMIQEKELIIQRRNETLLHKEQLLQEHIYLLQFQEASEKGPGFHDSMLEKLQERIRDRDKALERAVDEKYCAVEERESKLRQVQLAIREKEHDLERLRSVLSSNEETINSLDSMLKSKDIEIEQISTAYSNLQWLKQQMEEKYTRSIKDREGCIQQLQASLHDRHKELERLSVEWLRKSTGENNEIVEKLQLCLQSKEKMLQDVLSDRNQQATEHEKEIQELLKTQISSEKIAQTERGGDCKCKPDEFSQKDTRMVGFPEMNNPPSLNQQDELSRLRALLEEKEDIIADLMENGSDHSKMMVIVKNNDWKSQESNRDLQNALEKELANAKEEFQIASRKEREARLELSTLQSLVAKQNEDLQVQAADVESLSRSVQIKEELIKDLQVQLVNPEDVPAVESLTQEVLKLREKVAMMELHGQEGFGNRSQELILMLERLVAERARLNDALQSERQLYSNLVNYHSQPKSCEETKTLHLELEAVRVLRGHLEEALGQSLQQLSSLEAENRAPIDFGGGDRASLRATHKHAF